MSMYPKEHVFYVGIGDRRAPGQVLRQDLGRGAGRMPEARSPVARGRHEGAAGPGEEDIKLNIMAAYF